MHTIKPLDSEAILQAVEDTHTIITVEEHSLIGGLGSAVTEVLADNNVHCKLKRMAIPDEAMNKAYSWQELRKIYHLTVEDIVREVKKLCQNG
jgi:transketolase